MSKFLMLFFVLFTFASPVSAQVKLDLEEPQFINGEIVVESNDAGEVVTLSEA